jgi:triosephosphate isomerase
MGMNHTPATAEPLIAHLQRLRTEGAGRQDEFQITVGATVETDVDVEAFAKLGVDRLIVSPWTSTRDAIAGAGAFGRKFGVCP